MLITLLRVSGYKNLIDCEVRPGLLHAVTGCNSSGKSNLLEVIPFLAAIQSFSDEQRFSMLSGGSSISGRWIPQIRHGTHQALAIQLEADLIVNNIPWSVAYTFRLPSPTGVGVSARAVPQIDFELLTAKQTNSRSKMATLLKRTSDGKTIVKAEHSLTKARSFKTKLDMSALHSLSVREAEDFNTTCPVMAKFRESLLCSHLIKIDPSAFRIALGTARPNPVSHLVQPHQIVHAFEPYYALLKVRSNRSQWESLQFWLKKIGRIEDLALYEEVDKPKPKEGEDKPEREAAKIVLFTQNGRTITASELSTGALCVVAMLVSLIAFGSKGGALLIEEPETHLHPKAIVDLLNLFRDSSQRHTIIFSTHSPVALNSMKPEEVSVMVHNGNGGVTTKRVADIEEATTALDRGFLSFGDLLQSNFSTEDNE